MPVSVKLVRFSHRNKMDSCVWFIWKPHSDQVREKPLCNWMTHPFLVGSGGHWRGAATSANVNELAIIGSQSNQALKFRCICWSSGTDVVRSVLTPSPEITSPREVANTLPAKHTFWGDVWGELLANVLTPFSDTEAVCPRCSQILLHHWERPPNWVQQAHVPSAAGKCWGHCKAQKELLWTGTTLGG